MSLIPVGFANYVSAGRVVAIGNPASLPVKRLVKQAEERGMVVDLTSGRKVKAVLVLETNQVVLVARQPETIAARANLAASRLPVEPPESKEEEGV